MRPYTVQPGDSPASIAIAFAGCPKCARDLVKANPAKPTIIYPNGYETFVELAAGERLALPDKWFSGELDALPPSYFEALPSVDGRQASSRVGHPLTPLGLSGVDAATLAAQYGITPQGAGQYAFDASGIGASMPPGSLDTLNSLASNAGSWSGMTEQQQTQVAENATAALAAAVPVYGWVVGGLLEILYALGGVAQGGPGCCGTDTSKPWGTCDQTTIDSYKFSQYFGEPWPPQVPPAGSFEEFAYPLIRAAWDSKVSCWIEPFGILPATIALAQASWNATHDGSSTRTISYLCNVSPGVDPSGFLPPCCYTGPGGADGMGRNPIEAALNAIASASQSQKGMLGTGPDDTLLPLNSTMTITVNAGPPIAPKYKPGKPGGGPGSWSGAPASSSSAPSAGAIAVGAAATSAAALGLYAYLTRQSFEGAAKHLYKKIRGKR